MNDEELNHGDNGMSTTGAAVEIIQIWKLISRKNKIVILFVATFLVLAQGALSNILGDVIAGANFFQLQKHIQVTYVPLEDSVLSLTRQTRDNTSRIVNLEKVVQIDTASQSMIAKSVLDLARIDEQRWDITKDLARTVNSQTKKLFDKK